MTTQNSPPKPRPLWLTLAEKSDRELVGVMLDLCFLTDRDGARKMALEEAKFRISARRAR